MYCDFGVKRERGGIASTQAALPKRSSTASDTLAPVGAAQQWNGAEGGECRNTYLLLPRL